MGQIEINHTGSGGGVVLSSDGSDLLLGGTAIGGSPDLYRDNAVNATTPTAAGDNGIAIGSSSSASGNYAIALGGNSSSGGSIASGNGSVALGGSKSTGIGSFSAIIGSNASNGALANYAIAIGRNAKGNSVGSLALGYNTDALSNYSSAIGQNSSGDGSQTTSGLGAMALGGSYASGTNSFAAAIANNTSSYGATGANSVALGYQAKASNSYAFAVGQNNIASGFGSVALGRAGTASGNYSVTLGSQAVAAQQSKMAFSSGRFAADGDAQAGTFVLRSDTTNATAEAMTTSNGTAGSTNQIVAASDTCITFSGTIVAMQNGAQSYGSWKIEGLLVNDGGTTTLANSAITVIQNASSWGLALSADNTNNALAITVTGEASHNIRWVANVQTAEVTYA